MQLDHVSIKGTVQTVEDLLEKEVGISPALKAAIKILVALMLLLVERLNKNSKNSSNPPSTDKNRVRGSTDKKSINKPGGQKGHIGTRLKQIANPDQIELLEIDRRTLPPGKYRADGYEARQVFDVNVTAVVTEYRAQVLVDQDGKRYVAQFPEHVRCDVQYGNEVKVNAVYLSQFQLLPYQRIQEQFAEQMNFPLSMGTIYNFNQEAYELLAKFDTIAKKVLLKSHLAHADETSICVAKKTIWLHSVSNDQWTYFYPHVKRGNEATDSIGILPNFHGILCHDHWKPYYKYTCIHALCNSHHLRELTFAEEQDHQAWAKKMKELLTTINVAVDKQGGMLDSPTAQHYRHLYRKIIAAGEKECPEPIKTEKHRGRVKKTKSRNLLERLRDYEADTLRFMIEQNVPFTNNLSENDLRMTKVQQKISGCFRSMAGAYMFCRIRSYLSTCRKHNVSATDALHLLFQGELPPFIYAAT